MTSVAVLEQAGWDDVVQFYAAEGRKVVPAPGDSVLVAGDGENIVGAAWIDRSGGYAVLRKMRVCDAARGRGVGRRLLRAAVEVLGVESCWCLPWRHLRRFYEAGGFTSPAGVAPATLERRLRRYRAHGHDIVMLHRPIPSAVRPVGRSQVDSP